MRDDPRHSLPRYLTLPTFLYSIFSFGPSQVGVMAPQLPQRTARLEQLSVASSSLLKLQGLVVLDCVLAYYFKLKDRT
jgi:hypothetical protein